MFVGLHSPLHDHCSPFFWALRSQGNAVGLYLFRHVSICGTDLYGRGCCDVPAMEAEPQLVRCVVSLSRIGNAHRRRDGEVGLLHYAILFLVVALVAAAGEAP